MCCKFICININLYKILQRNSAYDRVWTQTTVYFIPLTLYTAFSKYIRWEFYPLRPPPFLLYLLWSVCIRGPASFTATRRLSLRLNVLKTQEKFYLADQSIKYALHGFNPTSIASMLGNIVFFELKRHGYNVYIGKNANKEIYFVATKIDDKLYVHVCRELTNESYRKIANLMKIKDHFPKIIVTLDDYDYENINGIKIVHFVDFLLND